MASVSVSQKKSDEFVEQIRSLTTNVNNNNNNNNNATAAAAAASNHHHVSSSAATSSRASGPGFGRIESFDVLGGSGGTNEQEKEKEQHFSKAVYYTTTPSGMDSSHADLLQRSPTRETLYARVAMALSSTASRSSRSPSRPNSRVQLIPPIVGSGVHDGDNNTVNGHSPNSSLHSSPERHSVGSNYAYELVHY